MTKYCTATKEVENMWVIVKYEFQKLPHVSHLIRVPRPTVTIFSTKTDERFLRGGNKNQ
jgi:hypothetical protein